MQSQSLRADLRVDAPNSARVVERRLRRFRPELQCAVRSLARRHPRLADLAASFPALLVALAVPRAGFKRDAVVARVIAGAPLAELARAAAIPFWLRKLDPEFFSGEVPQLPDNNDFCRRIMNCMPHSPALGPIWLDAAANTVAWGHEDLAIWVARSLAQKSSGLHVNRLPLIWLWGWFSGQPHSHAYTLIERPWTPFMQGKTALAAADKWLTEVALYANMGEEPLNDMWLQPGSVDGYEFVPLRSISDITQEARVMRNCVRSYGDYFVHDCSRLWSVQKSGERVATLEIGCRGGDPLLNVFELKAVANKDVSKDVWWAARRWLHSHDLRQLNVKPLDWNTAPLPRKHWFKLWKPYWLAKRAVPAWLPLNPSRNALDAL